MTDKLPTNEEVIEELTKNLKKSCLPCDTDEEQFYDAVGDQSTTLNENVNDSTESDDKIQDEYYVDEELLKNRDEHLDDEKLLDLKNKADDIKIKGNEYFQAGESKDAMISYTEALKTCPAKYKRERAILYANRAAARAQLVCL